MIAGKKTIKTSPIDLLDANNEFLRNKGFPEEKRLFAHGQGYDLVERPAIREDEPMILKENMNITVYQAARFQIY